MCRQPLGRDIIGDLGGIHLEYDKLIKVLLFERTPLLQSLIQR